MLSTILPTLSAAGSAAVGAVDWGDVLTAVIRSIF